MNYLVRCTEGHEFVEWLESETFGDLTKESEVFNCGKEKCLANARAIKKYDKNPPS